MYPYSLFSLFLRLCIPDICLQEFRVRRRLQRHSFRIRREQHCLPLMDHQIISFVIGNGCFPLHANINDKRIESLKIPLKNLIDIEQVCRKIPPLGQRNLRILHMNKGRHVIRIQRKVVASFANSVCNSRGLPSAPFLL